GTFDGTNVVIVLRQFGACVRTQNCERKIRCASNVGVGKIAMTVFLDFERRRPILFDSVAQTVQGTDAGISTPRKNQLLCAARANELVVNDVGSHSNQREVLSALANDFMACGEGNQMSETFHGYGVAIVNVRANCVLQRSDFSHVDSN